VKFKECSKIQEVTKFKSLKQFRLPPSLRIYSTLSSLWPMYTMYNVLSTQAVNYNVL